MRRELPDDPIETPDQLFHEHYQDLYSMAQRYTRNPEWSEDVTQEAALRIVRFWHQHKQGSSRRQTLAWAYKIVMNAAFDAARKRRARGENVTLSLTEEIIHGLNLTEPSHERAVIAKLVLAYAGAQLTPRMASFLKLELAGALDGNQRTSTIKVKRMRMRNAVKVVLTTQAVLFGQSTQY